uniref:Uncharacterized protein n=1 Tax=Trichuris muris TaxID=70415 RepID=A0A5S6QC72_TRIMR
MGVRSPHFRCGAVAVSSKRRSLGTVKEARSIFPSLVALNCEKLLKSVPLTVRAYSNFETTLNNDALAKCRPLFERFNFTETANRRPLP